MKPIITFRLCGAAATAVLFGGCASTELKLDLAMYSGDPSYGAKTSQGDATAVARGAAAVARCRELAAAANDRMKEAESLYRVFSSVYAARAKARGATEAEINEELKKLRDSKEQYLAAMAPIARQLPALADRVAEAVSQLQAAHLQFEVDPANAQKADTLHAAQSKLEMAYASVQVVLSDVDTSSGTKYVRAIRKEMESFTRHLGEALDQKGNIDVHAAVVAAADVLNGLRRSNPEILADVTVDQQSLERAVRSAVEGFANKETAAAEDIHSVVDATPFHSMMEFDNLQDAADPRWRVVKDPRNEAKWVELKSQAYFYSEGKNSVIAVRDRPDDFRIQNATNNPTALVRSQLEISRAVTSAAIAIGGAVAGVPKLGAIPTSAPGGIATTTPPADDSTQGEQQAGDNARLTEEVRLRNAVISNLRLRVRQVRSNLEAAGSDPAKIRAAADEFYAVVDAGRALLPLPLSGSPSPGGTAGAEADTGTGRGADSGVSTASGAGTGAVSGANPGSISSGATNGATGSGASSGSGSAGTGSAATSSASGGVTSSSTTTATHS